jgi:GNAT superfamily N-acetyltransferase
MTAADERVSIRPLEEADLGTVRELASQLGYGASAPEIADRLPPLRHSPFDGLFVASTSGGAGAAAVAGWIHVCASHALIHDPQAEIVSLVVDERLRGRRVGAALVAAAEAWARSRDLRRIRVRCQIKREGAHRFYEREGFQREKTQHVFGKPLTPD